MPTYLETFINVRAKAQSQDVGNQLMVQDFANPRPGKQKFKKPHVISSTSHIEKSVDCTCIYVLNTSSTGSG